MGQAAMTDAEGEASAHMPSALIEDVLVGATTASAARATCRSGEEAVRVPCPARAGKSDEVDDDEDDDEEEVRWSLLLGMAGRLRVEERRGGCIEQSPLPWMQQS